MIKTISKILTLLFVASLFTVTAIAGDPWDDSFKPGEMVCIWDIGEGDPLIHNRSNHSLKYWYRSKVGKQQSRYELRPIARNLVLRVLFPPLLKKDDGWFSGYLIVVKGGVEDFQNMSTIKKGENTLLLAGGRTYIANWQVLYFERARFKKDLLFGKGCKRKYPKY